MLTKNEAEEILEQAEKQSPGGWIQHSRNVAHCAELIANEITGMNGDKAYVLGLLHDIGRKYGVTQLAQVYDGYKFMISINEPEIAKVCLTHSFVNKSIDDYLGEFDLSDNQIDELTMLLSDLEFDDYDYLIQLCDGISTSEGIVSMKERMEDIEKRYGRYPDAIRRRNLEIKDYFEKKLGYSIEDVIKG